jgi:large subunit ribosomal protein L31
LGQSRVIALGHEDTMKEGIHPKFYPNAKVICSCGNTWTTGSTQEVIHTDMCYNCHPFYTGEQRMVDTEGQVDRFYKKLEARDQHKAAIAAREASKSSPDQPVSTLELGPRVDSALEAAGLTTISQVVEKITTGGDDVMLAIDGLGRKSLIDLKKRLRARGFLAEETVEAASA